MRSGEDRETFRGQIEFVLILSKRITEKFFKSFIETLTPTFLDKTIKFRGIRNSCSDSVTDFRENQIEVFHGYWK